MPAEEARKSLLFRNLDTKKFHLFHVGRVCQCAKGKGVSSWGVAEETQERTLCTHWNAKGVPSRGVAGETQEPSLRFLCAHWKAKGKTVKEQRTLCSNWKAKGKASQEQGGGERR